MNLTKSDLARELALKRQRHGRPAALEERVVGNGRIYTTNLYLQSDH
ncbi:MAG: hypothetical protein IPM39_27520 [Chloroflexi bacterium]|nr:hypothetical protein [Chloroflexota bacterium]